MFQEAPTSSARQNELLEAAYQYALVHGLAGLSLRPLAEAIGSSPRVLLFLFESKDGLLRALLARARADELALLDRAGQPDHPAGLVPAVERVWTWLAAEEHRPLLRLWAEAYTRSLIQPNGAWAGFARATVEDWLGVLAGSQPPPERESEDGATRRTLALAVLRGALLDLLATDDEKRLTEAVLHQLTLLRDGNERG
ncbi:TetR family transcriptional regulator [Streptomyces sp. NBC_00257]|uniref:TetR family transcriptional regulator n=1 Tax=unclassified Streptomyces TaxID=2593676 RepID=UPI00225AD069|nr:MULTISPECIES: TetR family transcriptional regulator [unclassified Streptomyces]MCX4398690.1 TetR family transcriptional regulator [Streptomyces sp. NBC_01767]MCX4870982.1 TetR family transcriptional regulator [Streptomyces sp. NBC_00906]MCX4901721.1 TetR family transcriptional regulator [Streptomyces sp. NBC_00892]MCX5426964.1 TetR family transcriptional regulator [Streptomyces sp. NBC_00062]WSP50989.1 TetR family transcriptional regulator [Streptomyces sp. NBC_01243]